MTNLNMPACTKYVECFSPTYLEKQDTETGLTILKSRYFKKDNNGNVVENKDAMFERVAKAVSDAEKDRLSTEELLVLNSNYKQMLASYDFLPNSPTLMNAGMPLGQLSACFVLPVEDSIEDIFEAVKRTAIIHRSGGGTGFNFSHLRAKNSIVKTTSGISSGPISFMGVFDKATEEIKQGGKRRGANMGMLNINHPDILEFIECKDDKTKLTNFNISVAVTDEFMNAVKNHEEYDLIAPETGEVVDRLDANMVFDKIVHQAWKNGEPGIIFIDEINRNNLYKKMESTNPCGEQPLLPYEACNLGSINLANMVSTKINPHSQLDSSTITFVNMEKLEKTVRLAVRFLNDVIDINKYPLPEIDEATRFTRKIGLGIMGFADLLIMGSIPYDSDEALNMAETLMENISEWSHDESEQLSSTIGHAPVYNVIDGDMRANLYTTTIAPTGTISMIAGVSSGIEPLFAVSYFKQCLDGNKFMEINRHFKAVAKGMGFYSEELMKEVIEKGSLHDIEGIPDEVKKVFCTSHEISPEWHVKMQAAFQKYTDNAISKTINFNNDANENDIREAYLLAYKLKCKGLTVYRDGSRDTQILNLNGKKDELVGKITDVKPSLKDRERVMYGMTKSSVVGCGKLYVTVNEDEDGNIFEVFTTVGKGGGCPSQTEATSRLISIALQAGVNPDLIINQLRGIKCPSTVARVASTTSPFNLGCTSCPDAIARTITASQTKRGKTKEEAFHTVKEELEIVKLTKPNKGNVCPECGALLRNESGCLSCPECYWSRCN